MSLRRAPMHGGVAVMLHIHGLSMYLLLLLVCELTVSQDPIELVSLIPVFDLIAGWTDFASLPTSTTEPDR